MLLASLCAVGMFRVPGQAQVLGGAPQVAQVVATGAQAIARAAQHLPIAAAMPNIMPVVMAAAVDAAPFVAAAAAQAPIAPQAQQAGGLNAGPSTTFDPASPPRADEWDFSVTISALPSGDIPPIWLQYFFGWLDAACLLGICSLERGKKDDNLHIQAAVRMRNPVAPTDSFLKQKVRQMKRVLVGMSSKISFKEFGPGQFMELMVGYCMKDEGKPHFGSLCKNIPDDFKAHAKAAWNAVRRSYEDAFVVLCRKNFFQQVRSTKFGLIPFVGIDLAFFRCRFSMMQPTKEIFLEAFSNV